MTEGLPREESEISLSELEYGDTIRVSVRETPLEVKKVKETDMLIQTEHEVIVKNQHGRYRLREDNIGNVSLAVSSPDYFGRSWDTQERTVEVKRVD